MKFLLPLLGVCMGSLVGSVAGGTVGWLFVRIFGSSHALSNPDLPGGMAWMFVLGFVAVGLVSGGAWGFRKGAELVHELPPGSND